MSENTPELPGERVYRCPACGTKRLPPEMRAAIAEFEALSEREQKVADRLLSSLRLYGQPDERAWNNTLWGLLRLLVPSAASDFSDEIARLITQNYDPESREDLPPEWPEEGKRNRIVPSLLKAAGFERLYRAGEVPDTVFNLGPVSIWQFNDEFWLVDALDQGGVHVEFTEMDQLRAFCEAVGVEWPEEVGP